MNLIALADTFLQVDAVSLVAGLTTAGGAIGGGILGAAKLITNVITKLHNENRQDRTELLGIVKSQWEQLNTLATTARRIARRTKAVQRKVGAVIEDEDDIDDPLLEDEAP